MNGVFGSPLRNSVAGLASLLAVSLCAVAAYMAKGWKLGDALYKVITTV